MAPAKQQQFQRWQPGYGDALRKFIISENFQGAVQLAVGLLFVSMFVFAYHLRFPGSCVAVLLYIVVAVTAAPDNHVGTRIFLCGFMIGPMWLALAIGGIVGTVAKVTGDATSHMVVLCVLGPLAVIPFAIVRVGTSHLYLWAIGMVSALYVGMPIIAGFPFQDLGQFWMRSVLFILVAAAVAMFAGSVLSMIVLPSLASHALEDEVTLALQQLGHHLSSTASHLFRPKGRLEVLPGHMQGLHPLLLQHESDMGQAPAKPLVPGLLDTEYQTVTAQDVYVALMDWFEHMSRPPGQQAKAPGSFLRCTQTSKTSSDSSTIAKSTFYGAEAAGLAAAVAAAAADSVTGWTDADMAMDDDGSLYEVADDLAPFSARREANPPTLGGCQSTDLPHGLNLRQTSIVEDKADEYHLPYLKGSNASGGIRAPPLRSLRLGSGVAAASFVAVQAKSAAAAAGAARSTSALQTDNSPDTEQQFDAKDSKQSKLINSVSRASRQLTPSPSISDVRQLLAHANQLLDAAAAEPQWLRGSARRFERAAWAELIAKSQLLALRLSALDLVRHDHMALMDASHSFPIGPSMEQLLKGVFASAAAVLALLADQLSDRSSKQQTSQAAAAAILQTSDWQDAKEQLLQMVEDTLVNYMQAIRQASPDAPVTLPRAHWVRQWMFFNLATLGVKEAVDLLAKAAAAAALVTPVKGGSFSRTLDKQCNLPQQPPQPGPCTSGQEKQQPDHHRPSGAAATAETLDIEAATAGNKPKLATQQQQQQQQQTVADKQPPSSSAAGHVPPAEHSRSQWLHASFQKHTAWVAPLLPLALNSILFKHLHTVITKDLPAMFSSKEAFKRQCAGRRFRAGLKYWFVLSAVMVAILVLLYCIPTAFRYAPNFGYSAAAVGMSDRVESTMHKVFIWVASSIFGAAVGWALMAHPAMANNPYALAAVMCAICLLVGSLGRTKNTLVMLYTLMTVASVVLCQYTPTCCADTGSTMMAVVRGASVVAAAVFAVAIQNLVWPWFTSSWAVEQLGLVFQEAADLLADIVCEIYSETDVLLQQQDAGGPLATGTAAHHMTGRLAMLDAAVKQVQQQLMEREQLQQSGTGTRTAIAKALSSRQAWQDTELTVAATTAAASEALDAAAVETLDTTAAEASHRLDTRTVCFSNLVTRNDLSASWKPSAAGAAAGQEQSQIDSRAASNITSRMSSAAEFNTARTAGLTLGDSSQAFVLYREMMRLLKERQQLRQQKLGTPTAGAAAAGTAAAAPLPSSPQQLQARILKPLVQVKISLLLDTTSWSSGLYATPPVVLRLLQSMFDVADALGALQQASSVKVESLSGTWYWTLAHMAQPYGQLLLEVIAMADAALVHVLQPTKSSAAELLRKIQDVQHQRYEYFARSRDLRHLLHMAIASDPQLYEAHEADMQHWQLHGQMRYTAAVYATSKVLDRMTAVARCALETDCKV